jgi:hypothetical protein
VITGFQDAGADHIRFRDAGISDIAQLTVAPTGADTLITGFDDGSITFAAFDAATLDNGDFIFV